MANHKSTTGRTKKPSTPKKNRKEPIPIDSGVSLPQESATLIQADNIPATQAYPGIEEEIRHRAYELYEERGRQEGFHAEDWARAETEILSKFNNKEKSA